VNIEQTAGLVSGSTVRASVKRTPEARRRSMLGVVGRE
jgi:hypothetical protein